MCRRPPIFDPPLENTRECCQIAPRAAILWSGVLGIRAGVQARRHEGSEIHLMLLPINDGLTRGTHRRPEEAQSQGFAQQDEQGPAARDARQSNGGG
jgi:hypothetical protein